jgi:aldose 1-epimerase
MRSERFEFGRLGKELVYQYMLENDQGMEVKIMEYGATITSLTLPCNGCKRVDLVCGFDSLDGYFSEDYKSNAPHFGSTIGRYEGRILDFDKQVWKGEVLRLVDAVGVKMTLTSKLLQEGYTGKLEVSVTFTLNNQNEVEIEYEANTDRETPLSLTNHTCFNLNGFSDNIRKHFAQIHASNYHKLDKTNVPTGVLQSVEGEVSDLRKEKVLHGIFERLQTGIEHFYVFDKEPGIMAPVALFKDPEFSRTMEVISDQPDMLFYTGYDTSDLLKRESGDQYGRFRAFCCETGPYHSGPKSKTVFAFSW